MKNKIARTPLDPASTFKDDPLRALRMIRFAKKFDLNIVENITEAVQSPNVRKELSLSVAEMRKKTEIDKIFEGKNAH